MSGSRGKHRKTGRVNPRRRARAISAGAGAGHVDIALAASASGNEKDALRRVLRDC